ncbi:SURF1 family protein [Massilia endophytica]|uniref:SURF1 family protein n=1 Tax=Massilia endophytica TaxID=2899220 RepID=UPI001E614782|nr:SURF1 family protein [Massilia endophytica]UGQ47151.1 SURF1 family protein [Massilia endophytica]
MRLRFRFKLIPFIATVLLVALGVSLGQWQDRRAAEKLALEAKLKAGAEAPPLEIGAAPVKAGDIEYRRVKLTGQFLGAWPLYLDNRPYQGRAGFYLLMPFRIEGTGMHVLVARGWVPRNTADRNRLPETPVPSGTITIEGLARLNAGHVMELGEAPPLGAQLIVQNVTPAQVAEATKFRFQPFVLEQTSTDGSEGSGPSALVRDWPAPALGVDKHRGYAFQWYALAAMALIFFIVTGFRSGSKPSR